MQQTGCTLGMTLVFNVAACPCLQNIFQLVNLLTTAAPQTTANPQVARFNSLLQAWPLLA